MYTNYQLFKLVFDNYSGLWSDSGTTLLLNLPLDPALGSIIVGSHAFCSTDSLVGKGTTLRLLECMIPRLMKFESSFTSLPRGCISPCFSPLKR